MSGEKTRGMAAAEFVFGVVLGPAIVAVFAFGWVVLLAELSVEVSLRQAGAGIVLAMVARGMIAPIFRKTEPEPDKAPVRFGLLAGCVLALWWTA